MLIPLMLALASSPHCLNGYFDLREKAIGFACVIDEEGNNIGANIRFCDRKELVENGTCSGRDDIPCRWHDPQRAWWCHDESIDVALVPDGDDKISVHYKTKSEEGDLEGARISSSDIQMRRRETIVASFPH